MRAWMWSLLTLVLFSSVALANQEMIQTQDLLDSQGNRLAVTWEKWGQKYIFIDGLQQDLFQRYKVQPSRGPKWQSKAVEVLEGEFDFNESASYWYERTSYQDVIDCGLAKNEDEAEKVFDEAYSYHEVKNWSAVKHVRGPQKTLLYIVASYTVVEWEGKTCDFWDRDYVFLNSEKSKESPVYLGILDSLPK